MCVWVSDYFIVGGLAFVPLSQQVDFPTSMGSQASESKLTCSDEQVHHQIQHTRAVELHGLRERGVTDGEEGQII